MDTQLIIQQPFDVNYVYIEYNDGLLGNGLILAELITLHCTYNNQLLERQWHIPSLLFIVPEWDTIHLFDLKFCNRDKKSINYNTLLTNFNVDFELYEGNIVRNWILK